MRTVHEGRSDFVCDQCNKRFKSYQSMKVLFDIERKTDEKFRFIKSACIRDVETILVVSAAANFALRVGVILVVLKLIQINDPFT